MDFGAVVRARRMVRSYDAGREVPAAALTRALDLARRAPSAGHAQGRDFLVLRRAADRNLFWRNAADASAAPDPWLRRMTTAPVLVLVLSDPERYLRRYAEPDKGWTDRDPARWPIPFWDVDAGMAALILLLTAVDEGLAACFFGVPGPRHDAVKQVFGVPDDRRVVGVVSLGYPAADLRSPSLRRGRRPAGEVIHDGRFGRPFPSR